MFARSKADAPTRAHGGLTSRILLQRGDVPGADLIVTWVDIAPGGAQRPHRHEAEQVYVILRGQGQVHVEGAHRAVQAGDLIRIPPGASHHAENTGPGTMSYVSAATPAFDATAAYDRWTDDHECPFFPTSASP